MPFLIPLVLMGLVFKAALPYAAELHWSFWLVVASIVFACLVLVLGQLVMWAGAPLVRASASYLHRVLMPMPTMDFFRLHEAHGIACRAIHTVIPECRPHAERTARHLARQIQIERAKRTLMLR